MFRPFLFLKAMKKIFIQWVSSLRDLWLPNPCITCGQSLHDQEALICLTCENSLPYTQFHLQEYPLIRTKIEGKIPVKDVFAMLHYTRKSKVQRILHQLKYKNRPEIGAYFGKIYGNQLKDFVQWDLIIPIPLHEKRLASRGYNQSEHIAMGLSESLSIPFDNQSIIRIVNTSTQTHKSAIERQMNMKDVFHVQTNENILDKHIVLVDDVLTTGATLEACGALLLESGAKSISICVLADAVL